MGESSELKLKTIDKDDYKFILGDTNDYLVCLTNNSNIRFKKGENIEQCIKRYLGHLMGGNEHLVQLPPEMPAAAKASESLEYNHYIRWIENNVNEMNCNEITITLKPRIAVMEYMYVRSFIKETIKACLGNTTKDSRIILLYEISNSGMFHYHGILSNVSLNALNNIRKNLNEYVGRTEIKYIRNMPAYINYMLKRYTKERENYDNIDNKYDLLLIKKDKKKKSNISLYYATEEEGNNDSDTKRTE